MRKPGLFPSELSELLSPRGARLLAGDDRWLREVRAEEPGRRFFGFLDAVDRRRAGECLDALGTQLTPFLRPMETQIPPDATWGMTRNYAELLPKTVRVKTAMLAPRSKGARVAERLGLLSMMRSKSVHALAESLSGRRLQKRWGVQVLCYSAGDYSGPHNDHHPEDAEGRDGYFDLHLSFSTSAVKRQLLVYERAGHFSEVQEVAAPAVLTGYKLPFWHYTTPLEAKPGREADARRWVLLGTFPYA